MARRRWDAGRIRKADVNKPALNEIGEETMSVFPTRVLLATDGSTEAMLAARMAGELCEKLRSELHVVYVGHTPSVFSVPESTLIDPEFQVRLTEIAERKGKPALAEQVERLREADVAVDKSYLRVGMAEAEVVRLAEELDVGLVVIGSRGLGPFKRTLMGSVSDSVVRHAHCPVLVVRAAEREEQPTFFPARVVLALDGSGEAEAAAGIAAEISTATASELHLVFALPAEPPMSYPPYASALGSWESELERAKKEAQSFIEKRAEQINEAGGLQTRAHLRFGRPDEEIVRLSEELGAGLVIAGSRGLGGVRRALMGSVSASVVRHAPCPVLVVREHRSKKEAGLE